MSLLPERYRAAENPQKTERRAELAVLVLFLLLTLWLVAGMGRLLISRGPPPVLPAEDSLAVQDLVLQESLTPQEAAPILQRPLFWQGRRPLAPPPVTEAQPVQRTQAKLEGVTLQGVYGAGDSLGLIASVDGVMTRIVKGQPVKGWQLDSYQAGAATFVRGARQTSLQLEMTTPSVRVASSPQPSNVQVAPESSSDPVSSEPAEAEGQRSDQEAQNRRLQQGGGLTFGGGASGSRKQSK